MSFTIDQISFFQYSINNTILLVSKDLLVNSVITSVLGHMVTFRYPVTIDDSPQEDGWGPGDPQTGFIVWNHGDVGGWTGNRLSCLGLIHITEVSPQPGLGPGSNLSIKSILPDIPKKEGDSNAFKICTILNSTSQERQPTLM